MPISAPHPKLEADLAAGCDATAFDLAITAQSGSKHVGTTALRQRAKKRLLQPQLALQDQCRMWIFVYSIWRNYLLFSITSKGHSYESRLPFWVGNLDRVRPALNKGTYTVQKSLRNAQAMCARLLRTESKPQLQVSGKPFSTM
jgi:hypothetical protein